MSDVEKSDYFSHDFIWKIKNFSSCHLSKGNFLESPCFTIENVSGMKWCLLFYPKGCQSLKDNEDFVSCFLIHMLQHTTYRITISYSIEIVDKNNLAVAVFKCEDEEFNEENYSRGSNKFMAIPDLIEEMNSWVEDILTIRCQIKTSRQFKQPILETLACTTIDVERCCLDWNIIIPDLVEYSESITFPIADTYDCIISLNLISEDVPITIHFQEDNVPQQVTVKISVFDKIGYKLASKLAWHVYKNVNEWTFPSFITRKLLQDCKIDSSYYDLRLECEVYFPTEKTHSESIEKLRLVSFPSTTAKWRKDPNEYLMQSKFRNIFLSENFSDVKLQCKDSIFPAHKVVLSVWSSVFEAMFCQKMLENETGVVDITDSDARTIEAFLEFMYTENVTDMDYDMAKNVILVANKYLVSTLVEKCALYLKSVLSVENVCEIISIADLIDYETLKSHALKFFKVNASKILSTAAWSKLMKENIELASDILLKLCSVICD